MREPGVAESKRRVTLQSKYVSWSLSRQYEKTNRHCNCLQCRHNEWSQFHQSDRRRGQFVFCIIKKYQKIRLTFFHAQLFVTVLSRTAMAGGFLDETLPLAPFRAHFGSPRSSA